MLNFILFTSRLCFRVSLRYRCNTSYLTLVAEGRPDRSGKVLAMPCDESTSMSYHGQCGSCGAMKYWNVAVAGKE